MTASPAPPPSSSVVISSADVTPCPGQHLALVDPADHERDPGRDRGGDADLGDPIGRVLVAERGVRLLLEGGGLDDQLGQDARVDPLDDRRHPSPGLPRAPARLLTQPLLGRRVAGGASHLARPKRAASAACWACSAAASAASRARFMKLTARSLASGRRGWPLGFCHGPAPDPARRRPVRPARAPAWTPAPRRSRSPGGRSCDATTPTSPGRTGSSAPSGSTSPTTG